MAITEKICTKCDTIKPLDNYYSIPTGRLGRDSTCKSCKVKYQKEYYQKNKTRYLERSTAVRYGLTHEDYMLLKLTQGSTCYICRQEYELRDICLDHNHQTGRVRKFLCRKCNMAVSVAEDTEYLEALLNYLEEHI